MESIPYSVSPTLDTESLAAAVRLRANPTSGQRYVQSPSPNSPAKDAARLHALKYLLGDSLRSFLTLPGLHFTFETMLLQRRERSRVFTKPNRRPERTYITCLEREPEIYRGSLCFIPGITHGHVKTLDAGLVPGSTSSIQTPMIFRYHQTTFEQYANTGRHFDAAFLDFSGPITHNRSIAIRKFWQLSQPEILIINSLNGRYESGWNGERAEEIIDGICGQHLDKYCYGQFRQHVYRR